jgi:ATP-dependent Clp endopeptidase proteolytic subunit ClpP
MTPPDYIINAAKRGLELLAEGFGGDGLTEGTKDAARRMAGGDVSDDKIIKANAWGARHAVDLDAGKNSNADDKEWPGSGAVAHYLWGINPLDPSPAREWFERQAEKIQNPTNSMKNWFTITNKSELSAEVTIYEEIGSYGITAKAFLDQIKNVGKRKITLRINSPGGEVFDGLAIYNRLREHAGGVEVRIDGIAASMASVIAMAGAPVSMAENALLMVHNPSGLCAGNSGDMRELADMLDKVRGSLTSAYERKTGKTTEEIGAMMDAETWMTAQEALAAGFIDEITGELKMAASVGKLSLTGKLADREKSFDTPKQSTYTNNMTEPETKNLPEEASPKPMGADEIELAITLLREAGYTVTLPEVEETEEVAPEEAAATASSLVTITANADDLRSEGAVQERKRIANIRAWAAVVAKAHKFDLNKPVEDFIASGKTLTEFKEHIITNSFRAESLSTDTDTSGAQGNTLTRESFTKLSPYNQSEFCKKGGRITE